jgi:lipopolysaccharide export system protein LptA
VRDGEKWARGDRAEFDNVRGVLVVTGNPEARQGPNFMRGTKVTFVVGKDTLEVENARTVFETERGVPKLLKEKR